MVFPGLFVLRRCLLLHIRATMGRTIELAAR